MLKKEFWIEKREQEHTAWQSHKMVILIYYNNRDNKISKKKLGYDLIVYKE